MFTIFIVLVFVFTIFVRTAGAEDAHKRTLEEILQEEPQGDYYLDDDPLAGLYEETLEEILKTMPETAIVELLLPYDFGPWTSYLDTAKKLLDPKFLGRFAKAHPGCVKKYTPTSIETMGSGKLSKADYTIAFYDEKY